MFRTSTAPKANPFSSLDKYPLKVEGNEDLIEYLSAKNILVTVDRTMQYACVHASSWELAKSYAAGLAQLLGRTSEC